MIFQEVLVRVHVDDTVNKVQLDVLGDLCSCFGIEALVSHRHGTIVDESTLEDTVRAGNGISFIFAHLHVVFGEPDLEVAIVGWIVRGVLTGFDSKCLALANLVSLVLHTVETSLYFDEGVVGNDEVTLGLAVPFRLVERHNVGVTPNTSDGSCALSKTPAEDRPHLLDSACTFCPLRERHTSAKAVVGCRLFAFWCLPPVRLRNTLREPGLLLAVGTFLTVVVIHAPSLPDLQGAVVLVLLPPLAETVPATSLTVKTQGAVTLSLLVRPPKIENDIGCLHTEVAFQDTGLPFVDFGHILADTFHFRDGLGFPTGFTFPGFVAITSGATRALLASILVIGETALVVPHGVGHTFVVGSLDRRDTAKTWLALVGGILRRVATLASSEVRVVRGEVLRCLLAGRHSVPLLSRGFPVGFLPHVVRSVCHVASKGVHAWAPSSGTVLVSTTLEVPGRGVDGGKIQFYDLCLEFFPVRLVHGTVLSASHLTRILDTVRHG
mmetsp:Transcript_31982/g.77792  ORF Transcript_31982/g.77792 Transcript_31982/m.77792 type:complete len:495 (+) Transcript_31982:2719-4203(+)